jgi:hypothetical protein
VEEGKMSYIKLITLMLLSFVLIFGGGVANHFALVRNDCRMPVQGEGELVMGYERHFTFTNPEDVNFYYLTDIIKIGRAVISIGDLLLVLGAISLVTIVIKYSKEDTKCLKTKTK